ncbi:MAG: hypothetical protein ACXW5U_10620 [Thermoanaerobaculia bacterium]
MDKPATKAECCSDLQNESGCRNNYFDGKRLTTDSFRVEQRYLLERRHLLNRAIYGWGVVYGFSVSGQSGRLKIGPGLALDECGRELLEVEGQEFAFEDLLDENEAPTTNDAGCWLLTAHYAEQLTGPVPVTDSCRCEHTEFERTCETVRYSLRPIPCDECCRKFECELKCDCPAESCCHKADTHGRGGCRCLCDSLTGLKIDVECGPLRETDEPCGKVRVDVRHGVPLACVKLVSDAAGRRMEIDDCGPRRLVKRNDLLFDLIRGCDLTRICDIGWKDWHRGEVSFEDFSDFFGPKGYEKPEYLTRFSVEFSRPVRKDTLLPDCFAMTVMSRDREGDWWQASRVPIVKVDTGLEELVRRAAIVVGGAWVEDGLRGRSTVFLESVTYVEIEVRGDFIVDCNGQAVDANAVGLSAVPTGNGTSGGTFVSSFQVARAKGASS